MVDEWIFGQSCGECQYKSGLSRSLRQSGGRVEQAQESCSECLNKWINLHSRRDKVEYEWPGLGSQEWINSGPTGESNG